MSGKSDAGCRGRLSSLFVCMLFGMGGHTVVYGAEPDSTDQAVHALKSVTVDARRQLQQTAVAMPVQQLTGNQLKALGVQNMADAVRRFAGATVKDYGGIGGLKTVSVRGLGAEHTAVVYDGVSVSNCQAGQIDIGRFNIDDVETLSLSVGQQNDLLQSARLYASAGVLAVSTRNPLEGNEKPLALSARLKGGSFGLVNPSIKWAQRLGEHTTYSVNGNFLRADGSYPFTLVNGEQVTREKRRNTDIQSWYAEGNLYHTFKDRSRLDTKVYYFDSERGLPGSVILYNNQANERLWDRNAFVQTRYRKTFSEFWRIQAEGKYNYSWNRYEDADVKYQHGRKTELNTQQEYYLSATALWTPCEDFSLSWANDGAVNTLESDIPANPQPLRVTWLSALNARWQWRWLTLNGTLVHTWVDEQVEQGDKPAGLRRFSPTVSLLYRPWASRDFHVRLMYKETFRVPTFNDLYYTIMGNTGLRPEKAHEYNAGLTWSGAPWRWTDYLMLTADGYYNRVDDKIVAMPSTYVWRMLNYGKVNIAGADVVFQGRFRLGDAYALQLSGTYAWQKAVDRTDPKAQNYGHQIPYTPKHSGNTGMVVETPWLNVGYSIVFAGERYSMKQNLPRYRLERYQEHTLSLSREFRLRQCRLRLQAEVVNLTDEQYDVIKYYPMPGRSYRGTVQVDL